MIRKEKKAARTDYDVFSFRLSSAEKRSLFKRIEVIRGQLNKAKASNEKIINKNDVILEALKAGLRTLRSQK